MQSTNDCFILNHVGIKESQYDRILGHNWGTQIEDGIQIEEGPPK